MSEQQVNITDTLNSLIKYVAAEYEYSKLTAVEKITIFTSTSGLFIVLAIVLGIALFFISATLVFALADIVGGITLALLIVSILHLLTAFLIYLNRQKWVYNPIARFVTKLLLTKK